MKSSVCNKRLDFRKGLAARGLVSIKVSGYSFEGWEVKNGTVK